MPTPLLPKKLTSFGPDLENLFQSWAGNNNVPQSNDYDMRGFYLGGLLSDPAAQTAVNPSDHMIHFNDKWKLPNHHSFSNQSMYSTAKDDPRWIGNYTDENKQQHWNLPPYVQDAWGQVAPKRGLFNLEIPN